MTVVLTALIVSVAAVTATVLLRSTAAQPDRRRHVLDERLLDQVIVTLKSGTTFAGVLYVEDDGAVVLAKAEHIQPDGTRVHADGEVILLRADVDFIQRP